MKNTLTTYNPATEKRLKTYTLHSAIAVQRKLKVASSGQAIWQAMSFAQRGKIIIKAAHLLQQHREQWAQLATTEMGKPIAQSRTELDKCADTLMHYAHNAAHYLQDEHIATEAERSYVHYAPLGVVLAIMPWNFPYWQVFRCAAPILMAGNAMVLKHASNVTGCALAIEKIFADAGLPQGVFQTLLYPSSAMSAVIESPTIAAVTFTGSTLAGKQIAAIAGGALKKQVLELGGSDAYVLLKDADLDTAIDICVAARLVNSGQSCVAAKRFVVVKEIYDEFVIRMTQAMKQASFGSPLQEQHTIGPLARKDLREELHQQVQASVAKGAQLLCGGYLPKGKGFYYPPTVLAGVKRGMPAYHEELFGPVAAIIKAKDEQEAMHLANDTIYGLGGAIFSKRKKHAEKLAAQNLNAGNCFVNAQVHSHKRMPFGGIKQSGYGRELGSFGIKEFVNAKTIFVR